MRIYGISDQKNNDNGENIIFQTAKISKIKLDVYDVQRAHRVRKEKRNEPCPVTVRLVNYKQRNEFMFQKSQLKANKVFPKVFIIEDLLTPLSQVIELREKSQ